MSSSKNNKEDESIAGKIQRIQELCAFPNHADAATALLSDRLMALCQVLAAIAEPISTRSGGDALKGLYATLIRLEECLVQILSMNRVVYLVQALNLQTDLERLMQEVSFRLQKLVGSLSPVGQEPLQAPLKDYQRLAEQHQLPFRKLRESLQEEQSRLAMCASDQDFAAFLKETIGHISKEELAQALTVLQQELDALSVQLTEISKDSGGKSNPTGLSDAATRGKAIQFQGLLGIVVARLQAHPKLQQERLQQSQSTDSKEAGSVENRISTSAETEYPSWALDPLTGALMTTPVKLRAPCQDIMDKANFIAWMDKGETKCPVCKGPMTSIAAKPDKELKQRIQQAVLKSHSTKDGGTSPMELAIMDDSSYQTIRPGRNMTAPSLRRYSSLDESITSSLVGMSIQEDKAHDTFDESFRTRTDGSSELTMTPPSSQRNITASSSKQRTDAARELDSPTTQKKLLSELKKVITDSPKSPSSRRHQQRPHRFIIGGGGDKATASGPRRMVVAHTDATTGKGTVKSPSSPQKRATGTTKTTSANNKNMLPFRSSQQKIRLVRPEVIQLASPKSGSPKFFDILRRKLPL